MQKLITRLEHTIGEKVYHLTCDTDSPINHVKDALFYFMKHVGQIEDAIKAQQEKELVEKSKQEELKQEISVTPEA